jgi:hypothetical protein
MGLHQKKFIVLNSLWETNLIFEIQKLNLLSFSFLDYLSHILFDSDKI